MNDDIQVVKLSMQGMQEHFVEAAFNYDIADGNSGWELQIQEAKIRKLNRKIGENLKRLYGYRCQICGKVIGEQYGLHIAEAHHIDYFVHILNSDANPQMVYVRILIVLFTMLIRFLIGSEWYIDLEMG